VEEGKPIIKPQQGFPGQLRPRFQSRRAASGEKAVVALGQLQSLARTTRLVVSAQSLSYFSSFSFIIWHLEFSLSSRSASSQSLTHVEMRFSKPYFPGPRCPSKIPGKHVSHAVGKSVCVVVIFVFVLGCSRGSQKPKSSDFLVEWLQSHGETNIVADGQGLGIAGNATRLRASLYGSKKHQNGSVTAETEFRVRVPGGREIVEYVAGTGESLEAAEKDAQLNFLLTTFHVVYRSFMNSADPHQTEEQVTINGEPRVLVLGDTMARSGATNSSPDLSELRSRFREMLSSLTLSPQAHWMKIVYAQHQAKVITCSVSLDNQENAALTDTAKKLRWPVREDFYMVKQFIVVK